LVSFLGIVQERDASLEGERERSDQTTDCTVGMLCGMAQTSPQVAPQAAHGLALLFTVLTVQRRRWLSEASATLCVLGGFMAAPLLTLLAWIGLMLPDNAPLHGAATTMLVIAIMWLSLALVSAHMHHRRQEPSEQ
jgi:apolipoprotein N-acyltransferase